MLNMIAYDDHNNGCFYLKLLNLKNNELICIYKIGFIYKNDWYLSILEIRNQICIRSHNVFYMQDPVNDVKLTKCIFNYFISKNGFFQIINKILNNNNLTV